jgi:hypothetical protein
MQIVHKQFDNDKGQPRTAAPGRYHFAQPRITTTSLFGPPRARFLVAVPSPWPQGNRVNDGAGVIRPPGRQWRCVERVSRLDRAGGLSRLRAGSRSSMGQTSWSSTRRMPGSTRNKEHP